MRSIARRGFFWGKSKVAPDLINKETEMKIMQYRGQIDFFSENVPRFETYLEQEGDVVEPAATVIKPLELIPGMCSPEGTQRFKKHAVEENHIPAKNFRRPYPLPMKNNGTEESLYHSLDLSTVGLGTYLGAPNDEDDFD